MNRSYEISSELTQDCQGLLVLDGMGSLPADFDLNNDTGAPMEGVSGKDVATAIAALDNADLESRAELKEAILSRYAMRKRRFMESVSMREKGDAR